MIISAGEIESFEFAKPIGIGLIDSAITLTSLVLDSTPDFLLFVGSAGSYGNYNILDIVESNTSSNIELSFFQKKSYTPIDNVVKSVSQNQDMRDKNIVNSSNYITKDMELSKIYLKHNIEIENMEFYSVLKVAQKFEIPAMGFFVVTNYTDTNAHKDFIANHKSAMVILESYIRAKVNL